MPSFESNSQVVLQPLDENVYINYRFSTCSTSASNDGYLPFGATISSSIITATKFADENNRTITPINDTEIATLSSIADNIITIKYNYPSTNGNGYYKIRMKNTLSNGTILEADFNRIIAKDI